MLSLQRKKKNHLVINIMGKFTFFKKSILALGLSAFALCAFAQEADKTEAKPNRKDFKSYFYVTADAGVNALSGDVNKIKPNFNGNIGLGWQFDNIFGIKGNIGGGLIRGEHENVFTINKGNCLTGDLNLTISLLDLVAGYNPNRTISLTPHIGVGYIQYRASIDKNNGTTSTIGYNNNDANNNPGTGIDKRKVETIVPLGIDIAYKLSQNWDLFLDFTANYTNTDLIDNYPSGAHNDWISSINLGAKYRINAHKNDVAGQNSYCNYWYVTADGGATLLFGDNKAWVMKDMRGNGNIGVGFAFHNHWKMFAKVGYGIYHASNPGLFTLNYGEYYNANINLGIDLLNLILGTDEERLVEVTPHIGIGQIQFRGRLDNGNSFGYEHSNIKGNGIGSRKVAMTIPAGIELTYKMSKNWDIFFDGTTTHCSSDLVEGIATGKNYDWMMTANAGIRYKFKTSCDRRAEIEEMQERMYPTPTIQCPCASKENCEKKNEEPRTEKIVEVKTDTLRIQETYRQNYTDLLFPKAESNKLNSQANKNAIEQVTKSLCNGYTITNVNVEGYSSPEGTAEYNNKLSEERANIAADFVKEELGDKANNAKFVVKGNGADWEGLYRAILGSNIADKENIVEQLKNASDKYTTLNNLVKNYPEIETLFPQLRRAGVTIEAKK